MNNRDQIKFTKKPADLAGLSYLMPLTDLVIDHHRHYEHEYVLACFVRVVNALKRHI